ncbi:MAG TPA: ATP-binding protein [Burkholderiaceae bacterium]
MVSERQLKRRLALGAALTACATAGAGALLAAPAWMALCLLAAAMGYGEVLRNLKLLRLPAAMPLAAPADAPAMLQQLEACVEHAPVALFNLTHAGTQWEVAPLNQHAHRLLAGMRNGDCTPLYERLRTQAVGERAVIWIETATGAERALLTVSSVSVAGVQQRLVALLPLENELESETLGAWRELTHVLTHEIMNSLTPIASLSRTAQDLRKSAAGLLPPDIDEDLELAFATIAARAADLAQFVNDYRTLSTMPAARLAPLRLDTALSHLSALVSPQWAARGGQASFTVEPPWLEVQADGGQLEQALINLVQNAADATRDLAQPHLSVAASIDGNGHIALEVCDNGPGVPDVLAAQIFTPFFTTKEDGSGIGLAMVRQLLHGNGATVRHAKPLAGGARFLITFHAPPAA